ncbi:MAG: hypothetical protein R3C28_05655 [Pirellulaceae bacterium]
MHHSVDLSDWDLSNLTIVPPEDIGGDFPLELKVTSIDSDESQATTALQWTTTSNQLPMAFS